MIISLDFWKSFQVSDSELDAIYNYLLETERPLSAIDITSFLITYIIENKKKELEVERLSGRKMYTPQGVYNLNEQLVFPAFNWDKGTVINVRNGINPDIPNLQVIEVQFSDTATKLLASNLEEHILNHPAAIKNDNYLDPAFVQMHFGSSIAHMLDSSLGVNTDLVCIADCYFPKALLVSVSVGHLNLCEAVLEMANGGPLSTLEIISQVELPTDVNSKLTEFSLNHFLQEDGRFDEVGPAGITSWFLKRLEPIEVQSTPLYLRFEGNIVENPQIMNYLLRLNADISDEYEPDFPTEESESVSISLSYPHWRSGTLPLTSKLKSFFPTAHETPRVKFTFLDCNTHESFPGWVVRPSKYIYGLREWYESHGLIPGSFVTVKHSGNAGEVLVCTTKNRNAKDWIKTLLVGTDGGIVFALLKQVISCTYDERMAIMISDYKTLDSQWTNTSKLKLSNQKIIENTMRELSKLNPQGQIHAQEIYSAVNIFRRLPPSIVLNSLFTESWSTHLGDLYFRLSDN